MNFQQRKAAFIKLGQQFGNWIESNDPVLERAYIRNNWFTVSNTRLALEAWTALLTDEMIDAWMTGYTLKENHSKQVALILAGNIPLVGFHDLLSVLITGHRALVKLSSDDQVLMEQVIQTLKEIEPGFETQVSLVTERLPKSYDAVIATGSNNSNRYFEHYFSHRPNLLRHNRTSVAVLTGNETPEDLQKLAGDIFRYFGLGCRNVSKIYVPPGYDFANVFENTLAYTHLLDHNKYANNYTYHKSILLMNSTPHLDNGYLLVRESTDIASPLSTLYFEYYTDEQDLRSKLDKHAAGIQCIVGKQVGYIPFGKAQSPGLADYADGVDTLAFLQAL